MNATSPRALRRLAGALLALALIPAVAFAVMQSVVQSESEARLAEIRDDQLDGLLFSVNQDAWDVATTWADRLDRAQAADHPGTVGAGGLASTAFVDATPAVTVTRGLSPVIVATARPAGPDAYVTQGQPLAFEREADGRVRAIRVGDHLSAVR